LIELKNQCIQFRDSQASCLKKKQLQNKDDMKNKTNLQKDAF